MPVMLQASAAAEEDRRAREARAALAASQERCQALQGECSAHSAKLKELQSKHKVRSTSFTLCNQLIQLYCQGFPVSQADCVAPWSGSSASTMHSACRLAHCKPESKKFHCLSRASRLSWQGSRRLRRERRPRLLRASRL